MSSNFWLKLQEAEAGGDLAAAERLCRKALEQAQRKSDLSDVCLLEGRLADLLIKNDKAEEAREILERTTASESDAPVSIGMLAQIYLATDDFEGIERLMLTHQRALIAEARPPYFSGAGSLLSLADRTVAMAEAGIVFPEPLTRAEQLAPEFGNPELAWAVSHRRGLAAEALGDEEEAIRQYRTLVTAGSRFPDTVKRLLMLLERRGQPNEALVIAYRLLNENLPGEVRDDLRTRQERLAKESVRPSGISRQASSRATYRVSPDRDSTIFGRAALAVDLASDFLSLERERGRADRFTQLDELVGRLLARRLAGEDTGSGRWDGETIDLTGLTTAERELIAERYSLEAQQSRGVWFLQDRIRISLRVLSPRHSNAESAAAVTAMSPEVIFLWAIFAPRFNALHKPIDLRERSGGTTPQQQRSEWAGVADLFTRLGVDARVELDVMAYGGGWSRLKVAERRAVQERVLTMLLEQAPEVAARYRAILVLGLVRAYYAKADKDGRGLRKRVVTARQQPVLVGYFAGDWLEFLDYMGEQPHPTEEIHTAVPESRIMVSGTEAIAKAAADLGIAPEQAAVISRTLWGTHSGQSPVEERVDVLRRYWAELDEIHARQSPGMPSLWGLVEEESSPTLFNHGPEYNPGIFRTLLSRNLQDNIERLWGTVMLPRWADRIVSSVTPHVALAESLVPALELWHGVALTAWFVCEGPMSRTPIEGMETYYGRLLDKLEQLGSPVDRRLFPELVAAQKRLHPRPREERSRHEVKSGVITFAISISVGAQQLDGFEHLRDVITRYRRGWAQQHLERYLRDRWEVEIRDASARYHRLTNDAGKPPALKTFARKAEHAVNRWFGGDVGHLYAAIGAKCPSLPVRAEPIMPRDRYDFARMLATTIEPALRPDLVSGEQSDWEWQRKTVLSALAGAAFRYIQTWEALGRQPTLREFGEGPFRTAQTITLPSRNYERQTVLADESAAAWSVFTSTVEEVLERTLEASVPHERREPGSAVDAPVPQSGEARVSLTHRMRRLLGGERG